MTTSCLDVLFSSHGPWGELTRSKNERGLSSTLSDGDSMVLRAMVSWHPDLIFSCEGVDRVF